MEFKNIVLSVMLVVATIGSSFLAEARCCGRSSNNCCNTNTANNCNTGCNNGCGVRGC